MRLALLLVLLAFAPLAWAQGLPQTSVTVFTEDPGRAFTPGAEEPVTVVVNYQPANWQRPAPSPSAEVPEDVTPTRIVLEVKQMPSWATGVRVDPPEILVKVRFDEVAQSYSQRAIAWLNVSPDAPALQREPLVVTATAEPNGALNGASAESPPLNLRATTVGKLNVTADESMVLPGGRWTVVPFTVRNEGNSDIMAKLNVTVRPENSQVEFVDSLQLARNESRIVEVRIRTPWTNAELGSLELEAVPIVDGEEAAASRAEVEVRGQSAVPAPPLALALLLALALRRRSFRTARASRPPPSRVR